MTIRSALSTTNCDVAPRWMIPLAAAGAASSNVCYMCHDIVPLPPFPLRRALRNRCRRARLHVRKSRSGDAIDAKLALGSGQLEPQPAPEAELVARGKQPQHLGAGVARGKRRFVGVGRHRSEVYSRSRNGNICRRRGGCRRRRCRPGLFESPGLTGGKQELVQHDKPPQGYGSIPRLFAPAYYRDHSGGQRVRRPAAAAVQIEPEERPAAPETAAQVSAGNQNPFLRADCEALPDDTGQFR